MNFSWFCGASKAAFNYLKPTFKKSSFLKKMMQNQTKSILLRTVICSSNSLTIRNLTELLEKSKQTAQIEGITSLLIGSSLEQGKNFFTALSGRAVGISNNSEQVQALIVKVNGRLPII